MSKLRQKARQLLETGRSIYHYREMLRAKEEQTAEIERSGFVLPYLEMRITTRCNMRCKHCGHLIPRYGANAKDLTFEEFKEQFNNLANAVKYIKVFSLVGGEILLSKHIYEIVEYVLGSEKLGEIRVISNGKRQPPVEFLKMISGTRVEIQFSTYPQYSDHYPRIKELCDRHGVKTVFYWAGKSLPWYDYGPVKRYHWPQFVLPWMAMNCFFGGFYQYCNGKLFRCPRINNAYELGLLDLPESEICRITEDAEESRRNLMKFLSMRYSEGCKYCNAILPPSIPAGEQLPAGEGID